MLHFVKLLYHQCFNTSAKNYYLSFCILFCFYPLVSRLGVEPWFQRFIPTPNTYCDDLLNMTVLAYCKLFLYSLFSFQS
ncbi:hypothetical protein RJT34_01753 [Clitoria ternatea]|uniref:Uncharacterized protein n=1 Tax=Clitoria ternatea TaxID=43366 RepID=A0AAN9PYN7_CLITE